jgi:O-antigen ligase
MPDYIRTLIVILIIATPFFYFVRQTALVFTTNESFARRRNLWFALTLSAFISHNFWLFIALAILLIGYAKRRESNLTALYFFILFVLPEDPVQIPGIGSIANLFEITYARLLALFIFLPAFLFLRKQSDTPSFLRTGPDKILFAYLLLTTILFFRGDSMTNVMRQVFCLFIDVFLPYYVVSRSLKDMQSFRDALLSLVLPIMLLAALAVFESYKSWLLYAPLAVSLQMGGNMLTMGRDGILRAFVSTSQPIALGYLMVVGIGLYLYLQHSITQKSNRRLGMALLVAGLIAPLSRGPWVGCVVLIAAFTAAGRKPLRRLFGLAIAALISLSLFAILPGGERVTNLLPFIGSTQTGSIDYRSELITKSLIVIERDPWFGNYNYLQTPEMQSMMQGQGIIDIVNTYIGVAIEDGLSALGLFVGFFVLTILNISRAMRSIPDKDSDEYLLGRVLLATLISIMVMIFTVSSISVIPIVYWAVAGLGVAYAQMVRKSTA